MALAGRSNVGKSSVLNCLLGRRGLARTSRTPGRTQQVNFFVGPAPFALVDLPGYGFARAPREARLVWGRVVEEYLEGREELRGVVVVVDARRGLMAADVRMLEFATHCGRPSLLVLGKIDKLRPGERKRRLAEVRDGMPAPERPVVAFSARTGEGRAELWRLLEALAGFGRGAGERGGDVG